ncbi:cox cluster protein [Halanaeroarchaeum sp. HSR-CO]|uniref:DUF6684 family protein n=1 Tax=Halanaeroarchaeum sp. HSR-CO TaxID=2866382 RepID=UPI00217CE229|nr:DUF6684 family protein [Halanaeroarchaeum sp. HSR-CO]UWG48229.1 cox cluster protein [Halanaeroarchaeum sp. HSR-CO]
MASQPWTTETLLDISVNVVPLVVLAAFLVLIMGVAYWGMNLTIVPILAIGLIVVPAIILAYVTYVAAIKIES